MTVITVDQSFQILVVILSTTLAIALILSIVALVKAIQVLNIAKQVVQKADDIADKAESVADFFSHASGPVVIARLISGISDAFKRKK